MLKIRIVQFTMVSRNKSSTGLRVISKQLVAKKNFVRRLVAKVIINPVARRHTYVRGGVGPFVTGSMEMKQP